MAGTLTALAAIIEGVSKTPPFRRVEEFALEDEPFSATDTTRHYVIEDGGFVGLDFPGQAANPRVERRRVSVRFKYCRDTDWLTTEGTIQTDLADVVTALFAQANWAGSSHIWAVSVDGMDQRVERNKRENHCIAELTFIVHVIV